MLKLIMTKGLPGSGKSTWARQQKGYKRINKDDLRRMLDNGVWSKQNEKFVLAVRDEMIVMALDEYNTSVIVDDTNLAPKHEARLRQLAEMHKAEFSIKDFTQVPIETCIKQDLMRYDSVGEAVIRKMYKDFLAPKITYPTTEWVDGLRSVIICDIDGTLALFGDANPYDRDFSKDRVNTPVRSILASMGERNNIILFSGRSNKFFPETIQWLGDNDVYYDAVYMRQDKDVRKDSIIKEEMYREHIEGKYNVLFVLDDRNQVVDLWRSLGLTCLQVAPGDF